MENLILSFNVVAPVFLLMAVGYGFRRTGMVTGPFLKRLNNLVFQVFLPCMLFNNIYKVDLKATFSGGLFVFALGSLLLLFGLLCLIVPRVVKLPIQRGVVIQGIFRSNYVIFGVTIVTNMFGAEQAALASLLSAILVPTYNFLAVVALEVFTSGGRVQWKNTLLKVLQNPLILSSLAGVLVSLCGIRFPVFLETTLADLAKLATPLAFLILGGDFNFKLARGNLRLASIVVFCKLVLIPIIFIPVAVWMGYRGSDLLAVALAFETPVAVSSYIMAAKAKADAPLAGQLVVLSSAGCIVTVFLMIFILKQLGLM